MSCKDVSKLIWKALIRGGLKAGIIFPLADVTDGAEGL